MIIRKETDKDIEAIRLLTKRAFAPMPYSNGTEPAIIDALRDQDQLTLSLVAEDKGTVVGQISFSPVTIDQVHDNWFGLGPVSVLPEKQGQKIGSQLINTGLDWLKENGAKGCVLIGNPDYYSRFGFVNETELYYGSLDRAFIQKLTFLGPARNGQLKYCRAFEDAAA